MWPNGQIYQVNRLMIQNMVLECWRGALRDNKIGQSKFGKVDDYGVLICLNGDRYEGQFKICLKMHKVLKNLRMEIFMLCRYGWYYCKNDGFFKGNLKNGFRHRNSVWKRSTIKGSDKYQGEYVNDKNMKFQIKCNNLGFDENKSIWKQKNLTLKNSNKYPLTNKKLIIKIQYQKYLQLKQLNNSEILPFQQSKSRFQFCQDHNCKKLDVKSMIRENRNIPIQNLSKVDYQSLKQKILIHHAFCIKLIKIRDLMLEIPDFINTTLIQLEIKNIEIIEFRQIQIQSNYKKQNSQRQIKDFLQSQIRIIGIIFIEYGHLLRMIDFTYIQAISFYNFKCFINSDVSLIISLIKFLMLLPSFSFYCLFESLSFVFLVWIYCFTVYPKQLMSSKQIYDNVLVFIFPYF